MARYIDADKLIAHLKDEIKACEPVFGGRANGKSVAYGTELGLKSAISFAETLAAADVAPKSEVEYWQDAAANVKREVARGFITDLKRMFGMCSIEDRMHDMRVYIISKRDYQTIIAELEKKYTGADNDA